MNRPADEATQITLDVLKAVQSAVPGGPTDASAQLNYLVGVLASQADALLDVDETDIPTSSYWPQMAEIFEQARISGATYETFDTIRVLDLSFSPQTSIGVAVTNYVMRLTLAEQAQCLAALTFTSRDQIDAYLDLIDVSFEAAIDIAADNMDSVVYTALISLRSAVVNDLNTRAIPLPVIVSVSLPIRLPAITIAQRLYQDASQYAALIDLNTPPNPLFMPTSFKALSLGNS